MARPSFGLPSIRDFNMQGRVIKGASWHHNLNVQYELEDICLFEGGLYECILQSDASVDPLQIPSNIIYWSIVADAYTDPRSKLAKYRDYLEQYSDKKYAVEDSDGNIAHAFLTIDNDESFQVFTTNPNGATWTGGVFGPDLLRQSFSFDPVIEEKWAINTSPFYASYDFVTETFIFDGDDSDDLVYDETTGILTSTNNEFTYIEPRINHTGE